MDEGGASREPRTDSIVPRSSTSFHVQTSEEVRSFLTFLGATFFSNAFSDAATASRSMRLDRFDRSNVQRPLASYTSRMRTASPSVIFSSFINSLHSPKRGDGESAWCRLGPLVSRIERLRRQGSRPHGAAWKGNTHAPLAQQLHTVALLCIRMCMCMDAFSGSDAREGLELVVARLVRCEGAHRAPRQSREAREQTGPAASRRDRPSRRPTRRRGCPRRATRRGVSPAAPRRLAAGARRPPHPPTERPTDR